MATFHLCGRNTPEVDSAIDSACDGTMRWLSFQNAHVVLCPVDKLNVFAMRSFSISSPFWFDFELWHDCKGER